jgi:hypothetical protein
MRFAFPDTFIRLQIRFDPRPPICGAAALPAPD